MRFNESIIVIIKCTFTSKSKYLYLQYTKYKIKKFFDVFYLFQNKSTNPIVNNNHKLNFYRIL